MFHILNNRHSVTNCHSITTTTKMSELILNFLYGSNILTKENHIGPSILKKNPQKQSIFPFDWKKSLLGFHVRKKFQLKILRILFWWRDYEWWSLKNTHTQTRKKSEKVSRFNFIFKHRHTHTERVRWAFITDSIKWLVFHKILSR